MRKNKELKYKAGEISIVAQRQVRAKIDLRTKASKQQTIIINSNSKNM